MEHPQNQEYAGCYAEMEPNGNLDLIAPGAWGSLEGSVGAPNAYGWFDGISNEFWSSMTWGVAPVMQVPGKSFGPFLAYVSTDAQVLGGAGVTIDNAGGFQVGFDPQNVGAGVLTTQYIKTSSNNQETQDLSQEIGGFVLMVFVAFL